MAEERGSHLTVKVRLDTSEVEESVVAKPPAWEQLRTDVQTLTERIRGIEQVAAPPFGVQLRQMTPTILKRDIERYMESEPFQLKTQAVQAMVQKGLEALGDIPPAYADVSLPDILAAERGTSLEPLTRYIKRVYQELRDITGGYERGLTEPRHGWIKGEYRYAVPGDVAGGITYRQLMALDPGGMPGMGRTHPYLVGVTGRLLEFAGITPEDIGLEPVTRALFRTRGDIQALLEESLIRVWGEVKPGPLGAQAMRQFISQLQEMAEEWKGERRFAFMLGARGVKGRESIEEFQKYILDKLTVQLRFSLEDQEAVLPASVVKWVKNYVFPIYTRETMSILDEGTNKVRPLYEELEDLLDEGEPITSDKVQTILGKIRGHMENITQQFAEAIAETNEDVFAALTEFVGKPPDPRPGGGGSPRPPERDPVGMFYMGSRGMLGPGGWLGPPVASLEEVAATARVPPLYPLKVFRRRPSIFDPRHQLTRTVRQILGEPGVSREEVSAEVQQILRTQYTETERAQFREEHAQMQLYRRVLTATMQMVGVSPALIELIDPMRPERLGTEDLPTLALIAEQVENIPTYESIRTDVGRARNRAERAVQQLIEVVDHVQPSQQRPGPSPRLLFGVLGRGLGFTGYEMVKRHFQTRLNNTSNHWLLVHNWFLNRNITEDEFRTAAQETTDSYNKIVEDAKTVIEEFQEPLRKEILQREVIRSRGRIFAGEFEEQEGPIPAFIPAITAGGVGIMPFLLGRTEVVAAMERGMEALEQEQERLVERQEITGQIVGAEETGLSREEIEELISRVETIDAELEERFSQMPEGIGYTL